MDRGAVAAAAEFSPPGGAASASATVSARGTGSSGSSSGARKRRRVASGGGGSGSSSSSRRRPAFSQQSFPIVRGSSNGGAERALVLLRLPEDAALPPAEVGAYLYAEEVVIEEEDGNGGREEGPHRLQQQRQHLRRRARPSVQWVLESEQQQQQYQQQGQARLTGHKQPLVDPKEPHCQYFILRINDGEEGEQGSAESAKDGARQQKQRRKRCELLPLEDVIVLRQAARAPSTRAQEDDVRAYLERGRRHELQARAWQSRYGAAGRALVAAWDACAGGEDEGGVDGKRRRTIGGGEGEGPQRRWVRTFRVDEDADAGEDSFNPSSKMAPSYQDILGGADDGKMEAVAGVFAEADLGADEIPDGADADGFNAAEFGEEDYVRVRDGQEQLLWLERNAPASIDPVLREMQGLVGENDDEEEDAGVYGTSSSDSEDEGGEGDSSGGGGLLGKGPGRAVAAGAAAAAASSSFAEGFAAVDARPGSETSDDYDGDDDDSEDEG